MQSFNQILEMIENAPSDLNIDYIQDSSDITSIICDSDAVIGALGLTAWETAALGKPSILIQTASNQKSNKDAFLKYGFGLVIDDISEYEKSFEIIQARARKLSLSCSISVNKINSASLIFQSILNNKDIDKFITLYPCSNDDKEFIYSLQTKEARRFSKNSAKPTYDEHSRWFEALMNNNYACYFIIKYLEEDAGYVGYEWKGKYPIISISVSQKFRGLGIASSALKRSVINSGFNTIKAEVHQDNDPSRKLFLGCGFKEFARNSNFIEYFYERTK